MPLVCSSFGTATDPARVAFGGGSFAGARCDVVAALCGAAWCRVVWCCTVCAALQAYLTWWCSVLCRARAAGTASRPSLRPRPHVAVAHVAAVPPPPAPQASPRSTPPSTTRTSLGLCWWRAPRCGSPRAASCKTCGPTRAPCPSDSSWAAARESTPQHESLPGAPLGLAGWLAGWLGMGVGRRAQHGWGWSAGAQEGGCGAWRAGARPHPRCLRCTHGARPAKLSRAPCPCPTCRRQEIDSLLLHYYRDAARALEAGGMRGSQRLRFIVQPDAGHHESAWAWRLPEALSFLLSPWWNE